MTFRSIMKMATAAAMMTLAACSSKLQLPAYEDTAQSKSLADDSLSIQYLGVGGHILSYKGTRIMTAPSFSNPHFMFAGPFFPMSVDEEKVDEFIPDVSDVEMILVGHAHYDHLLDVPYVMDRHARKAHVYGSNTMANTLAPVMKKERIHALNDKMGDIDREGEWIYSQSGKVRVMPIKASHAPHIMGIKFMGGNHDKPLSNLPWHAFGWKEGQTLAFIIDFLDDDKTVAHRIFYQDAASSEPDGLVPVMADGKAIDIAILCPAAFTQVDHYPESIVTNTEAQHFILGHWEDFFANNLAGEQRFVRLTNQHEFIERLEGSMPSDSTWTLPALFSTQHFAKNGIIRKP